ncbi:TetR family transcriptional regulator [Caulobacter mirabilis]|uniref:TetR family transcriptional regulator n=2 Tax=Caulobacter mirabilis TaxID=69666 RepID=A0A2D2B403_9CAUL|nr:TetR family transcriptional regulator [Caulobacter mirabilis]
MSTIAARLGGSKGTLYNYFRSKEELFQAVMQRQCSARAETLFDIEHEEGSLRARLEHYARSFLKLLLEPDAMALNRLVVGESERFPEIGRGFYQLGPRVIMTRMAAVFEEMMDQGVLRRADPLVAAQQFKDLAISGVYQPRLWNAIEPPDEATIERQVANAVDTFLRAYRA